MPYKRIKQLFRDINHYRRFVFESVSTAFPVGRRFSTTSLLFFVALVALLILIPRLCLAESPTKDNPHHFQAFCGNCHQSVDTTDTVENKTVGPLYRDINQACQSGCHDIESPLSHPVGIKTNGYVPPDMPLDDKGRITCLTCHDELNNLNTFPTYLRKASSEELCTSCHQGTGGTARARSHWQFTTKAHLQNNKPESSKEHTETAGSIDIESYTCLSCHDDKTVVIPGENETAFEKKLRWKNMSDHPIGMIYETRAYRKSKYYNITLTIDDRIRFFNGRMGCGSCHNLYNNEKNNLALSSDNGVLCRQCHIR